MIVLQRGRATARIDEERGGRLASLDVDGRELLVGAPDGDDRSIRWGCFLMAPWAGRIENGLLTWGVFQHRLRLVEGPHAIHGLVFDRPWEVEDARDSEAALSCRIGQPDWPREAVVRERFSLDDHELVTTGEIVACEPMPAAVGWHPWFLRTADTRLKLEAQETLETLDLIPTGRRLAVDDLTNLRSGPRLGERALDHVYPDAASPAAIDWPDFRLEIAWEGPIRAVVVHTTPGALCVEPQTAWPNAPALEADGVPDTGLTTLTAGASLGMTMRWRWV